MNINKNFLKLNEDYLFSRVQHEVEKYKSKNPETCVISLGIGDVIGPICEPVVRAMHEAIDEMGSKSTFKGYGPYDGYDFLKEAICCDYRDLDVQLDPEDIFVNDGSKSDIGNILEIFECGLKILIISPVYPVYVDTNVIAGNDIFYLKATIENDFLPMPDPEQVVDVIYICSPNNPIGSVYNHEQLKDWVKYAKKIGAILFFDAAYKSFVSDEHLPKSIFEIDGAKEVAIEFCSFSKGAGFTGLRCGYTVIPRSLKVNDICVNDVWRRRLSTKSNGVSYITQRAACATFLEESVKSIQTVIAAYHSNAVMLKKFLSVYSEKIYGADHSPYVWFKCPFGMNSWEFFHLLLNKAAIVGTPGIGFGDAGNGFFRFSAFCEESNLKEAINRMDVIFRKGL